jgi:hypothetical protein
MTALDRALPDPALAALRAQLEGAAASFVGDAAHLGALLRAMVDDVARANAEDVEVFPVKHHSPSSALHMVRRLRTNPPKVIFMEGCEDLNAALEKLRTASSRSRCRRTRRRPRRSRSSGRRSTACCR